MLVSEVFKTYPLFAKAVEEMSLINDLGEIDETVTIPDDVISKIAYVEPALKTMDETMLHSILTVDKYMAFYPTFDPILCREEYNGFAGDTVLTHLAGGEAEVQDFIVEMYGRKGEVANNLLGDIFDGDLSYIVRPYRPMYNFYE
jgi:hypothetical protein